MCSGLRPLRPDGFIPARPYQSEGLAGGRYGALETALGAHQGDELAQVLADPLVAAIELDTE